MSDRKYQELLDRRTHLDNELKNIEKQVFELETKYLEETSFTGNIIKGWGDYLTMKSSKISASGPPRKAKVNPADRVFSQSSKTSPFYQQQEQPPQEDVAKDPEFRSRRLKKKKNYANYKKEYGQQAKDRENNDNTPQSSSDDYQDNIQKKVKASKKF